MARNTRTPFHTPLHHNHPPPKLSTLNTSLSHTCQIQHTLPRRLICIVPQSHVHIPRGEFTVPPAKLDPFAAVSLTYLVPCTNSGATPASTHRTIASSTLSSSSSELGSALYTWPM